MPAAIAGNSEFHASQNWTITFAYRGFLEQLQSEDFRERGARLGQWAADIMRRLSALTKWIGPVAEPAAAAIKKVMETFVDRGNRLVWIMDMPLGGSVYQIRIVARKPRQQRWRRLERPFS